MDKNEQKTKLIKLAIYLGIFLVAIIIVLFDRNEKTNSNIKNNNSTTSTPEIIETIKNLNDDYYASKIHLTLDDDAISLEYERSANLEIGIKKYHKETVEYIKNGSQYYKFDNGEISKLGSFKDFDYDRTFTEPVNIKKLLDLESTDTSYTNKDLKILKKTINTKDVIKIYNEYNNKNLIKYDEGKIYIEIYYNERTLDNIKLDLTDLYNFLNKEEQEKVEYTLTFENKKEVDNSWILEKLP